MDAAKEPRLLAQDPAILLRTLEVFNSTLHLAPEECVAFAVRNCNIIAQPYNNKVRTYRGRVL
jgi:hypothetical protein